VALASLAAWEKNWNVPIENNIFTYIIKIEFSTSRSDRVSWLPPGHPKFQLVEPASRVREILQSQLHAEEEDDDQEMDLDSDMVIFLVRLSITHSNKALRDQSNFDGTYTV